MVCTKCGKECRIAPEQVGVDMNNAPIFHRFAYCDDCNLKWDIDMAQTQQPQNTEKKKNSTLSVWACVLAIFTCTLPIAFILALVDIGTNDKSKKHAGSWFAIICTIIVGGFLIFNTATNSEDDKVKKVDTIASNSSESAVSTSEEKSEIESSNNMFAVGDVVETKEYRISFISAGEHVFDNQFMAAKEGYVFYRMEFEFENISDSDKTLSSLIAWNCYADDYAVDQSWYGDDGIDTTLSPGKRVKGAVYFEIPKDAKKLSLNLRVMFGQMIR